MIGRRRFLLHLALLPPAVGLSRAALASGREVLVGLPNNVFSNLHDGRPTGIIVEAIDVILREMGRKPIYIVMSAADMSAALQEGLVGVNSVTVATSGNAALGLYTDPIVTEYNVVAIRAGQNLTVDRLSDLYGMKLGGRLGYLYPLLDADPNIHLERFAQDGELIRNLIHRRIDAAIISALSDIYKFRAEGVMSRIQVLNRSVGEVPLRAALSRKVFSTADLDDFNARLAELKVGSLWPDILARNGFADLAVEWPIVSN